MKFPYKTYVDKKYARHQVEIEELEWCCDEFGRTVGNQIVYEPDPDFGEEPIFVGFRQERRTGRNSAELVSINYCPFCGNEIVFECLGKFKTVTEEVRVE